MAKRPKATKRPIKRVVKESTENVADKEIKENLEKYRKRNAPYIKQRESWRKERDKYPRRSKDRNIRKKRLEMSRKIREITMTMQKN